MNRSNFANTNRGVALVITLAMVTMLAFLVVAFFSRLLTNRQVESASSSGTRADILAQTAAETILADLKAEIVAGSTATGVAPKIYAPVKAKNIVPKRVLSDPSMESSSIFDNLIKQSVGRFFPNDAAFPNGTPLILGDSGISTDVASLNGIILSKERWNAPFLLNNGTTGFTSNNQIPRWIMIDRQGVAASQSTVNKDYTPGVSSALIGRFAFNLYDEGGLLDVNVAGYPSSPAIPGALLGQKGTLALAQLATIPSINTEANADAFVKAWRNLATGTTVSNYLAYLGFSKNGTTDLTANALFNAGAKSGFKKEAIGTGVADNRLRGRQDLIRLATKTTDGKTGSPPQYGIPQNALSYLTTFTREQNAPSWGPAQDASTLGGNDGTGVFKPYAYKTNADDQRAANRLLPNVRVTTAGWVRLTGDKAVKNEPLIKYRFPLSWLSLLEDANTADTNWDLTPVAVKIIKDLDTRRAANGASAIPGATSNAKADWLVQRAFGLLWDKPNYRWNYTGSPTASFVPSAIAATIERFGPDSAPPDTIVEENREPNFFELLKAGILSGSLGNSSDFESFCANRGEDANADYQIMQIGANMIDQADSDAYPTRIAFGLELEAVGIITDANSPPYPALTENKVFAGIEDLPYIHTILTTVYRSPQNEPNMGNPPLVDATQTSARDYINAWLQFVMWKAQQNSTPTTIPPKFRILYSGSGIYIDYYPSGNTPTRKTAPILPPSATITFDDSSSFRSPSLLGGLSPTTASYFTCSQPQGNGKVPGGTAQLPRGFWLGETYRPENTTSPSSFIEFDSANDSKLELQYQDGTNTWRTYQRFDRFGIGTANFFRGRGRYGYTDSVGNNGNPTNLSGQLHYTALNVSQLALTNADPRSQRFGLMAMYRKTADGSGCIPATDWRYYFKQGWAPSSSVPESQAVFGPANVTRFFPSWSSGGVSNPWGGTGTSNAGNFLPTSNLITQPTKFWADNPATGTHRYLDMDLVPRRADGDSLNNVRPLQSKSATSFAANTQDMSVVLNRPFRSVGELAYVFRDSPWKTLDLFSTKSADSGLLDIFSVDEEPAVVAGKLNLNTRSAIAIQSLLSGVSRDGSVAGEQSPPSTNIPISAVDAKTIADKLMASTSDTSGSPNTGPLISPGDLADRLATILPLGNTTDAAVKARREAIVRALGGSGQTRTWNLLIDVVAQSGRYSSGASSAADLGSKFIVEGERRYWLHVAIDRLTGQIVDQQLETVVE